LRRSPWTLSIDRAFVEVMHACAAPRDDDPGTWITPEMVQAYARLHRLGHAHSLEVWREGELIGGIYGVSIGRTFSAESMFSRADDASKVALVALCRTLHRWNFPMVDAQVPNPHLLRMGAVALPRADFLREWRELASTSGPIEWRSPFARAAELA
jgi:leucyl/phenylalanyl-tRNA--protein transferase